MLLVEGEGFPTTSRNAAVSCTVLNTLIQLVWASHICKTWSNSTQSPAGFQNSAGEAKPSLLPSVSGGGGGGPSLYKLYRFVPPHRVGFLRRFGLKTCIHFNCPFWSEIWSGFCEPRGTPPSRIPRGTPTGNRLNHLCKLRRRVPRNSSLDQCGFPEHWVAFLYRICNTIA